MALYTFQAATQISGGGLRALPGASVTIYNRGTTVRAATYDSNGNALSNPMIADSNGLAVFYAAEGLYDVVATLGAFLLQQTIQVVLAATMKQIVDVNYNAAASDGGVTYVALTATRILVLPPLATMAAGKPFPVSDESGSASASIAITIDAAGSDLINGSSTATLSINSPYQLLAPVAGVKGWML